MTRLACWAPYLPLFLVPCLAFAQGSLQADGRTAASRWADHVVRVVPQRSDGGAAEKGFGIIVGHRNDDIFVVTPHHVVFAKGNLTDAPAVIFRGAPVTNMTAERLLEPVSSPTFLDFAVLRVRGAQSLVPSPAYLVSDPTPGLPVWSIGRQEGWSLSGSSGGYTRSRKDPDRLIFDGLPIARGSSGAAVVSAEGIVAMSVQDTGSEIYGVELSSIWKRLREPGARVPANLLVWREPPPPNDEQLAFDRAEAANTIGAFAQFLSAHPTGRMVREALNRVEQLAAEGRQRRGQFQAAQSCWRIFFDWDRANLSSQALATIKQLVAEFRANGGGYFTIIGHTDSTGLLLRSDPEEAKGYNKAIALRRAHTVKAALAGEGIGGPIAISVSVGDSEPLVPTMDNVREPRNRRVEVCIIR